MMSSLDDEALARILQAEFDEEHQGDTNSRDVVLSGPSSSNYQPMSLIDSQWELLDPTPDPRALFLQFNEKFFWGRLAGVEVRWSPRMTLCAGVCSYEGRGGLCSIRLSVPLLKLRPRKDLVETLLHEMIHAYLFVTQNNKDRDGHGPEFCKHKDRINKESGTKITIYHSFHDEVENYRQHWWRCDGSCKERKPFFGYVKRAVNRAPSHHDTWWANHQRTCGGTFTKVKEPEGYGNKKRKKGEEDKEENETSEKKQKTDNQDIRNFIPFGGQGNRLGDPSNSKQVMGGTRPSHQNTSEQKENRYPTLDTSNGHHSNRDKVNAVDSTDRLQTDRKKLNGEQNGEAWKTKNKTTKPGSGKIFDLEKKEKKLKELRAIFLSSSDDEDDNHTKTKKPSRTSPEQTKNGQPANRSNGSKIYIPNSNNLSNERTTTDKIPFNNKTWQREKSSGHGSVGVGSSRGDRTNHSSSDSHLIDRLKDRSGGKAIGSSVNSTSGSSSRVGVGSSRGDKTTNPSGGLHHLVDRMKKHSSGGEVANSTVTSVPMVSCPVCGSEVIEQEINRHLDSCLSGFS